MALSQQVISLIDECKQILRKRCYMSMLSADNIEHFIEDNTIFVLANPVLYQHFWLDEQGQEHRTEQHNITLWHTQAGTKVSIIRPDLCIRMDLDGRNLIDGATLKGRYD